MRKIAVLFAVTIFSLSLVSCAKRPKVKMVDVTPPTAEEPSVREKKFETVTEIKRVHFDFDKSVIRSDAREILKKNADYIKKLENYELLVEGHCDERGTLEYNMALGQRRAAAVRSYYIQLGIPADKIATISYGEERPLDPASNEAAWAKNRRAETLIKQ